MTEPGIYALCADVGSNQPIEPYVLDLPQRFPTYVRDAIGLKPGTQRLLMDTYDQSVVHVLDWLPTTQYQRVVYWLEEVRALGIRRRLDIPPDEVRLLGLRSRLVSLHSHGWIENGRQYLIARGPLRTRLQSGEEAHPDVGGLWWCPKGNPEHCDPDVIRERGLPIFCASIWWDDLGAQDGEPFAGRVSPETSMNPLMTDKVVVRREWGEFFARRRPTGITPSYGLAAIASWPITGLYLAPGTPWDHEYNIALRESGLYAPMM